MGNNTPATPLECDHCSGFGVIDERFACRRCAGTGHARCMGCKAHPSDAPAVRDCDGERYCAACARQFDADAAEYADCQAGHVAARTTESGWLALDAHETKFMELVEGERLGLRTCAFCRTTISRAMEMERAA